MQYTKLRELGRGSFGIVDLVRDEDGVEFARKTFAPPQLPGIDPDDLRARFEREVRYQSQIEHPNVVQVLDADLKDEPPWFIMRLAECSLADELACDRTLGGYPQKPLFDVLAGLEALHEKGYKHRDLKPANILKFVAHSGEPRYAISDFGLMTPGAGLTSTLTASNMAGGTPLYRPPECAISFRKATTQSDIYSVGAILHDIFAAGASRIPHVELTVSGPVGPIVEKCTKTNLLRRYRNVAALREALYDVLTREQISFVSVEEEEIVSILSDKDSLSEQEWDRVFQQIEENEERGGNNHAIFRNISLSHIIQLKDESPELLAAFGQDFASYAQSGDFSFEYCDVIASKAQALYEFGELDLQAKIAVSMLVLGTSHNRWLVEHMFMRMANASISDQLAERIRVEIEVQNVNFARHIRHVEGSISTSRTNLHPILQESINE